VTDIKTSTRAPVRFTESSVKALKGGANGKPYERRDAIVPNLALRVSVKADGSLTRTWKLITTTDTGRRVPVTLGTWPEMTAEGARAAARERIQAQAPAPAAKADDPTLHAFALKVYLPHVKPRLRTADRWANVVVREFPDVKISTITTALVLEWQAGIAARVSNSSTNKYMAALSSCLGHAAHLGLIKSNPASQSKETGIRLPQPIEKSRFFKPEEWERFEQALEASPEWFRDLCKVGVGTGARKAELLSLAAEDIDLQGGLVHFRAETTKTASARSVPATKGALEVLARRIETVGGTGPLFADAQPTLVQYRFDQAREAAGVSKLNGIGRPLSFRSIRTTVASWLVQRGADLYHVSRILGNSPMVCAEHYGHLAPRNLQDTMGLLG
jgi:integrase